MGGEEGELVPLQGEGAEACQLSHLAGRHEEPVVVEEECLQVRQLCQLFREDSQTSVTQDESGEARSL